MRIFNSPLPQVYMGTWHETTVAVKILLGTTMVNSEREAEEALEESRKVSASWCHLLAKVLVLDRRARLICKLET